MKLLVFSLIFIGMASCSDPDPIPKPPSYLRLGLPEHTYQTTADDCSYSISTHEIYTVKPVIGEDGPTCHKDIDLGPLNGTIHLSYIDMTEPLATYVNFVNDKVDEHKVKASAIEDKQFIRQESRVFCTFFELQGDVASPYQFYLTDSTSKFMSGVVYFNSTPNYDSLKPSLDYLKIDLEHMINTFEWKK
jgi:gliding motility-associated lipoprotein GldD